MLPLINIAHTSLPVQPTLVATAIPENNALRVPHDNVAPPVSSAQTDPNARGNAPIFTAPPQPENAPPSPTASSPPIAANLSSGPPIGAPATLLAQLIGQQLPPEVQNVLRGVLQEYEKLVVTSYVKYKPSNATLPPPPEPAGSFSKLLKPDTVAKPNAAVQASPPAEVAVASTPVQQLRPVTAASSRSSETNTPQTDSEEVTPVDRAPARPVTAAIQAYRVSVARNDAIKPEVESVEEADAAG